MNYISIRLFFLWGVLLVKRTRAIAFSTFVFIRRNTKWEKSVVKCVDRDVIFVDRRQRKLNTMSMIDRFPNTLIVLHLQIFTKKFIKIKVLWRIPPEQMDLFYWSSNKCLTIVWFHWVWGVRLYVVLFGRTRKRIDQCYLTDEN